MWSPSAPPSLRPSTPQPGDCAPRCPSPPAPRCPFPPASRPPQSNPMFVDVTWGAGGSTSELTLALCQNAQRKWGVNAAHRAPCEEEGGGAPCSRFQTFSAHERGFPPDCQTAGCFGSLPSPFHISSANSPPPPHHVMAQAHRTGVWDSDRLGGADQVGKGGLAGVRQQMWRVCG